MTNDETDSERTTSFDGIVVAPGDDHSGVLQYASRNSSSHMRPKFWLALLLAAPGSLCWALFVFGGMFRVAMDSLLGFFGTSFDVIWPLWIVAVVSGVASLVVFVRPRKDAYPWYIVLCLVVNIPGLLFSIPMIISIASSLLHH